MGKFTSAILLMVAIELALYLFMSQTCVNIPSDISDTGQAACHTSLLNMILSPTGLSSDAFFSLILGNIGKIATLSAIIVGFFFILRIEVAYAGIAIVAATFVWNVVQLWTAIRSQGVFGDSASLVATIIAGPLLIFYIIAVMDYIRRPD